ncbi:MAG: type I-E CRISPR-associated protein Cas5/CasD [Myxococcota bacterium]
MSTATTTPHLVFGLQAPLASWGDVAVGEMRPSANRPTRSCLAGLVAACLGLRRCDEERLRALDALRFAVRVEEAGLPMHDYHTVQVPRAHKGVRHHARRDELEWKPRRSLGTILSTRAYRMEVRANVAVTRGETERMDCPSLELIARAMQEPVFAPYLGRRSCPLAAPLAPRIIFAETFTEAESSYRAGQRSRVEARSENEAKAHWYWEDGCATPAEAHRVHSRTDHCVSHTHRLFSERTEYEAILVRDDPGENHVSE